MNIELKHIAPYFPYMLNFKDIEKGFKYECMCLYDDSIALYSESQPTISFYFDGCTPFLKPILRPLSDLHTSIDGIVPANFLYRHFDVTDMEFNGNIIDPKWGYGVYVYLFSLHFDIFNLINSGHAIDINTLPKN